MSNEIKIKVQSDIELVGDMFVPKKAKGLVVFAHGSGSSRKSPRNRKVALLLNQHGLGTLLIDLLTEDEAAFSQKVFNIELLANRLKSVGHWLAQNFQGSELPLGLFGASTGAAAAVVAAAKEPDLFRVVVSRGGRIDLAKDFIEIIKVPLLAIVGEKDTLVLELNRQALAKVPGLHRLVIIPGATHLFEELGCLDRVAEYSATRFVECFGNLEREKKVKFGTGGSF